MMATKTEEEAGELIWPLIHKEIHPVYETEIIRNLWCTSRINSEALNDKRDVNN